jgi:hypothetical protein
MLTLVISATFLCICGLGDSIERKFRSVFEVGTQRLQEAGRHDLSLSMPGI